ncbi:DUF6607 family protein [Pedobacter xixiisoli]|uniref:Uncharacterized protein n=1 Tax=Pedobacter xixiisoli TaxID=1476464 RepID=A0A286ADT6_9SPHI|nr:DUF6607 family protein [Pedobacter xixiisoli]SOD20062.1 hypothetical protein SAMN06297358_3772 [Pedobacter xixiisoli]
MKKIHLLAVLLLSGSFAFAQNKFEQDRNAIKALAGFYKVTFNYAETFSPNDDYKYHDRHRSSAKEIAIIVEDSPKKIVIQHLLVMRGDSMIIKHWREDWTYEDPKILAFDKEDTWKTLTLKPEETKGKWTQKVFQVDDSPRYQAIGSWVHVDGRSQWLSYSDSPLPRREHTERNDYNVLNRRNFVYLTPNGWMFEQDNKKIVRTPGEKDKMIAQEKGLEEFVKTDPKSFAYSQEWWKKNAPFWKDARDIWDNVFANNTVIKLAPKVDNKLLYEKFFAANAQSVKENWSSAKNKEEITKIINAYLIKG